MRRWGWIVSLAVFVALPALADDAIPDLRGTWTGRSESAVMGAPTPHQGGTPDSPTRFTSIALTLVVDKQQGRAFSGTISSVLQKGEPLVGMISRTGAVYYADTDGYVIGTMLAPGKLEICYLQASPTTGSVASCTVLVKQP